MSDVRAGKAYIELYMKDGSFNASLQSASLKMRKFGNKTVAIGKSMAKTGLLMVAPLVKAGQEFAKFEQQMANVSTMLDDPTKYMAEYTKTIKEMSISFGEGTDTLSKGLYDILSASIDPAQALDVLAVSATAAKAGITDTGVAADAITTILNSYGLSAEHAGDVSDMLFATVKRGKTTFAELAPNIGKVASTAAKAGLSIEEMGGALAVMTRNGVNTEMATTALNNILMAFLNPKVGEWDVVDQTKLLGGAMNTTMLKTIGLKGVLEKLKEAAPEDVAKVFPNILALKGVLPALGDLDGFSSDLKILENRAGSTSVAFDKMADTLMFKYDQAKQAITVAISEIGMAVAPVLKDVATWVKKNIEPMREWIKTHSELIETLLVVGGKLVIYGGALLIVGKAINGAAGIVSAIGTLIKVFKTLGAFLIANPYIALAAAVVAVGAGIYYLATQSERAQKRIKGLEDQVKKLTGEFDKSNKELDKYHDKWKRLGSLNKKILSDEELGEAKKLIDELQSRYGQMGIGIDAKIGTITGLSKDVEIVMKEKMEVEKYGNTGEYQNKLLELNRKEAKLGYGGLSPEEQDKIIALNKKISEQNKQRAILEKEANAAQGRIMRAQEVYDKILSVDEIDKPYKSIDDKAIEKELVKIANIFVDEGTKTRKTILENGMFE